MNQSHDEEDLFAAALALPASERNLYLRRACGDDAVLCEQLTGLLAAFGDASSFVNEQSNIAWDGTDRIDPYRLLQELGEGGCGVAYLAEQTAPVKRHVALKVIKPGMDTKAVIARFEAERQVLALLDHPNIAKIFDAGTTREGRPYFVMELIRGIKITDYCDHSRLTIRERLSLFIQVCQAIQHAHQKGIIHRDIKPSNVLVTMHDGSPVAKVIDFGISKALQGRLTDQTLHTAIDQLIGTPTYVSPEQTEPGQGGVDTRSDIYSLGVLLYELLTGQTPFDIHELLQTSVERLRERIRNEEPSRPSKRLRALEQEQMERVSTRTGTSAAKLIKQICGDLDWIVLRCLEKEPARRYQTVNELVSDVHHYMRYEPVVARPPGLAYTMRKFARRNRLALASAAAGIAIATTFALGTVLQAHRIDAERSQTKQMAKVVLNAVAAADPFRKFERGLSGRKLLDQYAASVQEELDEQPEVLASLLERIGIAYRRWDEYDKAITYLSQAVQLRKRLPHQTPEETANAILDLVKALRLAGRHTESFPMIEEAAAIVRQHGLAGSTTHAKLMRKSGYRELHAGRPSMARQYFEKSLHIHRKLLGPRSAEASDDLLGLARVYLWDDDLTQAEHAVRESISILENSPQSNDAELIPNKVILGEILYHQNRLDAAERLLVEALEAQDALFGTENASKWYALDTLADLKVAQGKLAEAEETQRSALASPRAVFGEEHETTAYLRVKLARILIERANYSEAEPELRSALATYSKALDPNHQQIASIEYALGELLLRTDRLTEAESVLTASMNRWKRSDAPSWRAARSANALGEVLYRQGRIEEGRKYLAETFAELSNDPKAELQTKTKARKRFSRYLGEPDSQSEASPPVRVASERRALTTNP